MRYAFRIGLAGVVALGLSLAPSPADATPSSGVTATTIFHKSVDGTDYTRRRITIQPGGTTGWHYHNGPIYVLVTRGVLTHSNSFCATDGIYKGGSKFIEASGADRVHIGRNLGSGPLVLEALYVNPTGTALVEDAPNPGCPFQ